MATEHTNQNQLVKYSNLGPHTQASQHIVYQQRAISPRRSISILASLFIEGI